MAMNPDTRLKIRHFFVKYQKPLIVVFVAIIIIIMLNRFLVSRRRLEAPQTTYQPNVSVIDSSSEVPKKVASSFEEFIDKYIKYCNSRDYVNAYNLVSEDCKKNFFGNNYDMFVEYVQQKFTTPRSYAIQDYSNYDDKYIYSVKLFDDFLATGLTNMEYKYQEEKMVASYDENNNIVFSVGNYIESRPLTCMNSNEYLKAEITNEVVKYSFVIYTLELTNRSDYTIVIKDGNANDTEVGIKVGNEFRGCLDNETKIVIEPGQTIRVNLSFDKFYDSATNVEGLVFNAVRIMENYTGNPETAEMEIENAVDKFSMTISL